jgi:hypothetical protein
MGESTVLALVGRKNNYVRADISSHVEQTLVTRKGPINNDKFRRFLGLGTNVCVWPIYIFTTARKNKQQIEANKRIVPPYYYA